VSELEEISALVSAQLTGTSHGRACASRLAGINVEKWQGGGNGQVVAGMEEDNGEVISGKEGGIGDGANETDAPNCPPSCATNPMILMYSLLVFDVGIKL